MDHFAIYLKLTQNDKSTILQNVIKLVNTQSNQKTWLKTIAQKGLKATKYIKTSARIGKIIYKQQISK